jgi:hypothetical protein
MLGGHAHVLGGAYWGGFLIYHHDLPVLFAWDHVCSASRAVSRHSAQKERINEKKSDGARYAGQLLDVGQWLH